MTTPGPLSRSDIRSRIAEAVRQGLGGWTESRFAFGLLGKDARSVVHQAYAVGIGTTTPASLDRQRTSVGSVATTSVTVRFAYRIRGDAQVADTDAALDAGHDLVAAVMAVDRDPGLSVTLVRMSGPTVAGDGTFALAEVEFSVLHRLALST